MILETCALHKTKYILQLAEFDRTNKFKLFQLPGVKIPTVYMELHLILTSLMAASREL